jgi:hypothetical protein
VERHLQDGLPGLLLRVPARAFPARCAGRIGVWNQLQERELGPGCRYPVVLRLH